MRISVALCTRNGERFVAEQLRSILDQSPAPAQIVISDDDSTDRTIPIARETLQSTDTRIDVGWATHRPAVGVTKNFESAVRAADGELVALSDQDDVWRPGKLAAAIRVFEADPAALLLFTDARLIDAHGAALDRSLLASLEIAASDLESLHHGDAFSVFLRRNLATGATIVFRKSLLERALPFPESWVHDEWLAMVAAVHGGVRLLPEATIDYRQHDTNEIGIAAPTMAYKLSRVLRVRGSRNTTLASKFEDLEAWARAAELPSAATARIAQKARFERVRANLPAMRALRIPTVIRLAVRGLYPRFASRGWFDVVRDLLQPA